MAPNAVARDLPHPTEPEAMLYPGWWAGIFFGMVVVLLSPVLPQRP